MSAPRTLACLLALALPALGNLHVAASVALAAATHKPAPEYSQLARQLKITGSVAVEVTIGRTGAVEQVDVLSGPALLSAPVVRTVKAWRFKPFLKDNEPTVATTVLRFNFN